MFLSFALFLCCVVVVIIFIIIIIIFIDIIITSDSTISVIISCPKVLFLVFKFSVFET